MNFLNFLSSGPSFMGFNLNTPQRVPTSLFKSFQISANSVSCENIKQASGNEQVTLLKELGHQNIQYKKSQKDGKEPIIPTVIQHKQKLIQDIVKQEFIEQLMTQQQQLINQYMQLNLQLMSQKNDGSQQHPKSKLEGDNQDEQAISLKKKIKKRNHCGHLDKEHYAKGMCNNCYHKYGRTKKPWNCQHEKLYASGLCQNCYINKYNKDKRSKDPNERSQEKASESMMQSELEKGQ